MPILAGMRFLITIAVSLSALSGLAQQLPYSSIRFGHNPYYNPSYIVNEHRINASVQYRHQWVGFNGNPVSLWANASYLMEKGHSALGVTYLNDRLGAVVNNNARINYAAFIRINEHSIIPALYLGFMHSELDGSQLTPIQGNDPNIPTSTVRSAAFNLGFGLSYRFKGLLVGFGVNHAYTGTLRFSDYTGTAFMNIRPHYVIDARYDFKIRKLLRIEPMVQALVMDRSSYTVDGRLGIGFDNLTPVLQRINVIVGYRHPSLVNVGAEFCFKWFTVGYVYDVLLDRMGDYSSGSHEAVVRLHLMDRRK